MIEILLTILLIFAGLLGALLLMLLVVLLSPVRLRLALQEGTFFLWAGLGPVRLRLLPPKPKKKKGHRRKKRRRKARASAAPSASEKRPPAAQAEPAQKQSAVRVEPETPEERPVSEKGDPNPRRSKRFQPRKKLDFNQIKLTVQQLTDYARLALDAMGQLRRRIQVRRLQIHAVIATGDASSTAMAFGSAAAAFGLLEPLLEEKFRIKRRDIAVDCAFDRTESTVEFDIEFSALTIRLLVIGLRIGLRFWKQYKENQEKAVLL